VPSRRARFCAAIVSRYATRPPYWPVQLSMLLAQRWSLNTIVQRHSRQSFVMIAPRLEVRLNTSVLRQVADGQGRAGGRRIAETSVEDLQTRARRIEPVASGTVLPRSEPPARVLRRRAPPLSDPRVAAQSSPKPEVVTDRRAPVPRSPSVVAASIPSLDVERLTDQVIKGIDRRIIAQRERLGRF